MFEKDFSSQSVSTEGTVSENGFLETVDGVFCHSSVLPALKDK